VRGTRSSHVRAAARLLLILSLAYGGSTFADDQDTVDYRQAIMSTMGEQVAALNAILAQKAPPDYFAVHVQILALTATMAKKAFEPKVPGGEAKPEIWANGSDFVRRLDALSAATADLARTAAEGGIAATAPKFQAALTCKGCHDNYREQKPVAARPPEKDAVAYREHVMNTLNAQSQALGMVLSTAVPDDNAIAHLTVIALCARTALKAFEAHVPGGEAKPEVWSNWPDFSKRMNEFSQHTGDLVKIARDKGKEAALSNVLDALTCKSCHDVYREERRN
jgi:cytochrome c556